MGLSANVIGATGLVGKQLVNQLLEDENFDLVRIFVRRDVGLQHPKLEQLIIDFSNIESWQKLLKGDVLFSALGTTLKQAGGQQDQYAVDYTMNYNFAKVARKNSIPKYVLISSMSADSKAKMFYPRMKGELDDAVTELQFEDLSVLRPGPLAGKREERRLGEIIIFPTVGLLTKFMLKKYRPIQDSIVAKAMINAALFPKRNTQIWEGEEIFELASKK